MPPKKPSRNTPNARDTRHENGLAAPGKRISKKGSNGRLNGQPNAKPATVVPPPALPSTGLNQGLRFPRPADPAKATDTGLQAGTKDDEVASEGKRRERTASETSMEDAGPGVEMGDNGAHNKDCPKYVQSQLIKRRKNLQLKKKTNNLKFRSAKLLI